VGIPEDHTNYRDEIYDSALMIADRIKAGEIVPPKSAEEYEAFRVTLEQ
jgi:basic membrane protein A